MSAWMTNAYRSLPRRPAPAFELDGDEHDSLSGPVAAPSCRIALAIADEALGRFLLEKLKSYDLQVTEGSEQLDEAAVVVIDSAGQPQKRMTEVRRMTRADAAVVCIVASADAAAEARLAGASACVHQPVDVTELAAVLSSVIEPRDTSPPGTAPAHVLDSEAHISSIGRISAGLAHQLGNPLGVAAMNLDVIGEEVARLSREGRLDGSVVGAALQDLDASFAQMQKLLAHLGPFVHGSLADLDNVPVADAVAGVIHRASEALRGIEVESCIEPLTARADPALLEQIVFQLTLNAAQAARSLPAARVRYHVYRARDRVIVSVRDNGPGIAAHTRDKIFEPFFTTRRGEGATGMGLALCREYARRMGATLSVWSALGRGACFRVGLCA
jgi:signal transduction histidine kinase